VALDDPADAVLPDSRAEIVASFVMTTDSELGLRLDIENIVFLLMTITADINRGGSPPGSDRGVESPAAPVPAAACLCFRLTSARPCSSPPERERRPPSGRPALLNGNCLTLLDVAPRHDRGVSPG
jgi:hypothetical protein